MLFLLFVFVLLLFSLYRMSLVPVLETARLKPMERSQTNLIVNYLPEDVTEVEIKSMFSQCGEIESCHIARGVQHQCLGYCFVNFQSPESAAKAIQQFNKYDLRTKTLKVSYARPSSSEIRNANLYVAHLPKSYTINDLEQLFAQYGDIVYSKLLMDRNGTRSRGAGFIQLDTKTQAEAAISALNNYQIPGQDLPLIVKHAKARREPIRSPRYDPINISATNRRPGQFYSVHVANLPDNSSDCTLYQLFSPYGAIASVKAIMDSSTNKCKGYGFVNMLSFEDAHRSIMGLDGISYKGQHLQVNFKS